MIAKPWMPSFRPPHRLPVGGPGHHRDVLAQCRPPPEYRKNTATVHAVPPARVRPPPATLLPLGPAPGGGPPARPTLAHAWPGRCPPPPTPAAGPRWGPPARQKEGRRPITRGVATSLRPTHG